MSERKLGLGKHSDGAERLELAAIGIEAEFDLYIDDRKRKPEEVFGDPRAFLGDAPHRRGTSYHLPTGGAVYFDTGVIEVVTPVIEIAPGCAARAGRSLWEGIHQVRSRLDEWSVRNGADVRLSGFSAHYNVSFTGHGAGAQEERSIRRLARLLAFVVPFPVMLLAANRRSTGVGVRPRRDRAEVTVDFTPSPALTIATATIVTGILRQAMGWPTFRLQALEAHDIPVIRGFRPVRHTSRSGWLARADSFPRDPFRCDVDDARWATLDGRTLSLRQISRDIFEAFEPGIREIADPFTMQLIDSVFERRTPVLLDLPDRPEAYDDVGRLCRWDDLFPERTLDRSRYERVLIRAISGQPILLGGARYTPVAMEGWSRIIARRDDGTRHVFSLDFLTRNLERWDRRRPLESRPPGWWRRDRSRDK